jgi:hypothetical protein
VPLLLIPLAAALAWIMWGRSASAALPPTPVAPSPVATAPRIVAPATPRAPQGLQLRANAGMAPKGPPAALYAAHKARIDAFLLAVNESAAGLRLGANDWYRAVTAGYGEDLSQHLLGLALDVQGPDQEVFASRAQRRGLIVLREGNDGTSYRHLHVQSERAGLVTRLGLTRVSVASLQARTARDVQPPTLLS